MKEIRFKFPDWDTLREVRRASALGFALVVEPRNRYDRHDSEMCFVKIEIVFGRYYHVNTETKRRHIRVYSVSTEGERKMRRRLSTSDPSNLLVSSYLWVTNIRSWLNTFSFAPDSASATGIVTKFNVSLSFCL